ncbi:hypothetical protein GGD63_006521 [Bradyrhizobium sp. cir1]|nr:hypothetical protein [Bradyrhizobium sp. cir1]
MCRHYLSNGPRQGRYWTVGDARNTPGRSMFVRLSGPESGPGAAGQGIGFFCGLLFTLAVFALPFFVGLTIGAWAFHTGAGALGGIAAGLVAGGATIGIGQLALAFVPWTWLRLLINLLYVAPATAAGYSAMHGIAQMAMSSPAWQTDFAVVGLLPLASRP